MPGGNPRRSAPFVINAARDLWRLGAIGVRLGAWAGWTALHPVRRARVWTTKLDATAGMLRAGPLAPPSTLNHQIGPQRQIRLVRLPLEDVRAIAHARGGTVNDVVLTFVTQGLHEMVGRADETHEEMLNALVPVGLATGPTRGMANRVSALLVKLPVGSGDVEHTLAIVSSQTAIGRRSSTRSSWPMPPFGSSNPCRRRHWPLSAGWSSTSLSST